MNQEQLALRALGAYPIASPRITFLRQNENMVFHVFDEQAGNAYLLRIHTPLTRAFQGERLRSEGITSELRWLEALTDETSLVLQRPVRTKEGFFLLKFLKEEKSMPDFVTTILAALIGSIIGSVGAVLTDHWLTGRSEKFHRREILVQRYLFQLQDALEMLYYRFHNLAFQGGRYVMTDDYFEETTLYALGKVLALERIFALEAVYPQLDIIYPGLGSFLKEYRIDLKLQHTNFYQYDRIALAETVIEHEGDVFRTSTYLEFRKRYEVENSPEKQWLMPASKAIQSLSNSQMEDLIATLKTKAKGIAKKTGIDSSLARN